MATTAQIITGLARQRHQARTPAAVARCDQQIAVHRQLEQLYADSVTHLAAGEMGKARVLADRIREQERLVHETVGQDHVNELITAAAQAPAQAPAKRREPKQDEPKPPAGS